MFFIFRGCCFSVVRRVCLFFISCTPSVTLRQKKAYGYKVCRNTRQDRGAYEYSLSHITVETNYVRIRSQRQHIRTRQVAVSYLQYGQNTRDHSSSSSSSARVAKLMHLSRYWNPKPASLDHCLPSPWIEGPLLLSITSIHYC